MEEAFHSNTKAASRGNGHVSSGTTNGELNTPRTGEATSLAVLSSDVKKQEGAMTPRRQLIFMQEWGERRQQLLLKPEQLQSAFGKVTQPSCGGGPRTFVPSSAWEGLPEDMVVAVADECQQTDALAVEDPDEAPQTAALLARADQLSDESAASVQTLCGQIAAGRDDSEPSVPRKPGEVAALLRNITMKRRDLYGRDECALRLERDIWQELRSELERQNRLDAQLVGLSSPDNTPCPSCSSAATSVSERQSHPSPSSGSGQRSVRSDRHAKRQVTRTLSAGLGSITSRLRRRVFPSSGSSGEPTAKGSSHRKKAAQSAVTALQKSARTSVSSETESGGWDSDSESEFRRRANRCRWRRSRVRTSQAVHRGVSGNTSSNVKTAGSAGSNCSNAQTSPGVAGCGLNLDDGGRLKVDTNAESESNDDLDAINGSSVPVKRPVYRVTDAAAPKKQVDKVAQDNFDDDLDIFLAAEQLHPTDPGRARLSGADRRSGKADPAPQGRRPKSTVRESSAQMLSSPTAVKSERAKARRDERVHMRSQVLDSTEISRSDFSSILYSDPDFHYRQSSRFFTEGLPVDEEAKRIVAMRRSGTPSSADFSDCSSVVDSCDRKKSSTKFITGQHGRLSVSVRGHNFDLPSKASDAQIIESGSKARKKKHSVQENRNSSNRLRFQETQDKSKEAEMVAMHGTETHFTSDCQDAAVNRSGAEAKASFCTETQASRKTLIRRRCRHVVLIQPQLVHWDLQLTQVVANPRARLLPGQGASSADANSWSSNSHTTIESHSDLKQLQSVHSLPTVTSRSAMLLAERSRLKPVGSLGQIVHWARVGSLPRIRRSVVRVKRVAGHRSPRRSSRFVRVKSLHSNVCHVTEIVDNPSLTQTDSEESVTIGVVATGTTTVSTCDAATNSSGDSFTASASTKTDVTIGSGTVSGVTISDGASDALFTARRRWPSRGLRNRRLRHRQQQQQEQQQQQQQQQEQLQQTKCQNPALQMVGELGDFAVRVHAAAEAKPLALQPEPWVPDEVTPLLDEAGCQNCTLMSCTPVWLFAKRSRQPKSGYSHSVHYLPSIRIPGTAAAHATEASKTLLLACELTVKRRPRHDKKADNWSILCDKHIR